MTAASPGVISFFIDNDYYPSHRAYIEALAGIMQQENEAIHKAGHLVQIDCLDLAMGYHIRPGRTTRSRSSRSSARSTSRP